MAKARQQNQNQIGPTIRQYERWLFGAEGKEER